MQDTTCTCIYQSFSNKNTSAWSTTLDFLLSMPIFVFGVIFNYVLWKKLKQEKKLVPLGRKGNVIEPIMSWYCLIQIAYWPYSLLYFWIIFNGITPTVILKTLWCNVGILITRFGRMYIAYNSLFVAMIRYIYIVYYDKAKKWDFLKVRKFFQITSVAFPLGIEFVGTFFYPYKLYQGKPEFRECIASYQGLNTTQNLIIPDIYPRRWTMKYVPEIIALAVQAIHATITIVVVLNIIEGFFYFQIFKSIQR